MAALMCGYFCVVIDKSHAFDILITYYIFAGEHKDCVSSGC